LGRDEVALLQGEAVAAGEDRPCDVVLRDHPPRAVHGQDAERKAVIDQAEERSEEGFVKPDA
jgi:hypothetical protein